MSSTRTWYITALANFLVAALLGLLLRSAFVVEIPWLEYGKALQTHSHLAMLGWLYQGIFALFGDSFMSSGDRRRYYFTNLFWITQVSVVAMTVSMLVFGYQHVTIVILGLFLILSYVFYFRFARCIQNDKSYSASFARWSLRFMALSTVALWALGPIMATGMRGTALYYADIQFFLHFQLNGWFIFAALALFFRILENHNIHVKAEMKTPFLGLLVVSCLFTYALAVTWSNPIDLLFWINSLGVSVQLGALVLFLRMVLGAYRVARRKLSGVERYLYGIAMISFTLKILAQTVVFLPYFAVVAYTIRNFVIAFIHIIVLGIASHMVLAAGGVNGLITFTRRSSVFGVILFSAGFILSELLLTTQGALFWAAQGFMPNYYVMITIVSALIPLGILLLLNGQRKPRTE